jgi:GTPase
VAAVDAVLDEIGAGDRPRVLVLNKLDLVDGDRRHDLALRHPGAAPISAATGEGLTELGERIERIFADSRRSVDLLVPFSEGGRLAELHELDGELRREDTPDGVRVQAQLPTAVAERYDRFAANGARAR